MLSVMAAEAPGPQPALQVEKDTTAEDASFETTSSEASTTTSDLRDEQATFPTVLPCLFPPCEIPVPTIPTTLEELPLVVLANEVQENVIDPIPDLMFTTQAPIEPEPAPFFGGSF